MEYTHFVARYTCLEPFRIPEEVEAEAEKNERMSLEFLSTSHQSMPQVIIPDTLHPGLTRWLADTVPHIPGSVYCSVFTDGGACPEQNWVDPAEVNRVPS